MRNVLAGLLQIVSVFAMPNVQFSTCTWMLIESWKTTPFLPITSCNKTSVTLVKQNNWSNLTCALRCCQMWHYVNCTAEWRHTEMDKVMKNASNAIFLYNLSTHSQNQPLQVDVHWHHLSVWASIIISSDTFWAPLITRGALISWVPSINLSMHSVWGSVLYAWCIEWGWDTEFQDRLCQQ